MRKFLQNIMTNLYGSIQGTFRFYLNYGSKGIRQNINYLLLLPKLPSGQFDIIRAGIVMIDIQSLLEKVVIKFSQCIRYVL